MSSAAPSSASSLLAQACDGLMRRYLPSGVLIDEQRRVVRVFGGAERFLGGSEQLEGRPDLLALADEGWRAALSSLLDAASGAGGAFARRNVRHVDEAGEGRLELTAERVSDGGDGPAWCFVRFELHGATHAAPPPRPAPPPEAPDALADTQHRLRLADFALQHAAVAVLWVLADGRITWANQAAGELFGLSEQELLTRRQSDLRLDLAADDWLAHWEALRKRRRLRFDAPLRRADGRECHGQVESHLLEIDGVEFDFVCIHDITDRLRTEAGLRRMKEALESRTIAGTAELEAVITRLRQSETRFRQVVESSPSGIVLTDRHGRIVLVNPRLCALTGYAADELLGQSVDLLLPADLRGAHASHRERYHEAPTARGMGGGRELFVQRKDGHRVPIEVMLQPLDTAEGPLVLASLVDVTARKDALALLENLNRELEARVQHRTEELAQEVAERRRAEAELLDLYNLAPCGYHSIDATGRFVRMNDTELSWLGYTREELEGRMAFRDVLTPEGVRTFEEHFPVFQRQGWIKDVEFDFVRKDGSVFRVLLNSTAVRDTAGNFVRTRSTLIDITEAHRSRQALRAEQELLREFMTYAPAAIAMLDTELRYLHTSLRWRNDYGLGEVELAGRSHYEIFPDVPERWREIHRRALAGEVLRAEDDPFPRADGRMEWLQWEVRPWRRSDGGVGGLLFFTQVITERKRLQLRLEEQNRELARSNHDLAQFAYAASHDLQEPLRAVAGCLEILQQRYGGQFDARGEQLIFQAVDGAKRMQGLIHGLLDYSRVTTRGTKPRAVSAEAAFLLAVANLRSAIAECGATITREGAPLPEVVADPVQLAQLFQNLLGNALKYRRSKLAPIVQVTAAVTPEGPRFAVRDNGIGIESKHYERIFGLFQRLHTRTEYPGTGIGLALCRKIVERHGGRIWVESTPGEGSTFFFTLPPPPASASAPPLPVAVSPSA